MGRREKLILMIRKDSKKIVIAGYMLGFGILLPFITSHGLMLLPGNVFLPMHIPVLLCSFFCGPIYGGICGFLLPYLNSLITGMPAIFPNGIVMSFELMTYGIMCSVMYKLFGGSKKLCTIYPSLIVSMIMGRVVYGIVAAILFFTFPGGKKLSVIGAILTGIPGILIQLLLVPYIVRSLLPDDAKMRAIKMIRCGEATCVVVKNNKIISSASPKGISHIIGLYDEGLLEGAFVADTIIGKAASMVFTLAGVKECYGETMSNRAKMWLLENNIDVKFDNLTDVIENRRGDGMCPMEETVLNVSDAKEGLSLLRDKVITLQNKAEEVEKND